jgi:hypothetical protein
VLKLIRRRRRRLQERALRSGARLYRRQPRAFAARVRSAYRAQRRVRKR